MKKSALKTICSSFFLQWGSLIILALVTALLYNSFFLNRAYVEFNLDVDHKTSIEMFWVNDGESYSYDRMARTRIKPGKTDYGFFLDDLRTIKGIRFDPMAHRPGTVTISNITISQPGLDEIVFANSSDFNNFVIGNGISSVSFSGDKGWTVVTNGGNPNFHLKVNAGKRSLNIPLEGGRFLILLSLLYLLFKSCTPIVNNFNYISLLAVAVLVLVFIMALTSLDDHHPDERVHTQAAAYYESHWQNPAVDAPEIASTYSIYGFSRLNSKEICYFLTGKLSNLLSLFHLNSFQSYRFFNVALLSILVMLTFQSMTARLLFIPMLMTPQAWYIFSYYNSDAFALFTAMITSYLVVYDKSLFNRYLGGKTNAFTAMLLLGPLFAALLLTKRNFYFFLIFIALYFLSLFALKRYQFSWSIVKRLFLIICVGLAFLGIRYGVDISVNGLDKGAKVQEMRELHANSEYKPSTNIDKKHPNLHLKSRGVTLQQFLEKYRWGGKIVRSFYGVYGYMTVSGTTAYYVMMRNAGFLFIGFVMLTIIIRGGWWENILLLNTTICCVALIGAACYRAWLMDFQAQGRFLLVILPMLGILFTQTQKLFQPLLLRSFIVFMFFMSAYSFIFVGINNIAKYGWG